MWAARTAMSVALGTLALRSRRDTRMLVVAYLVGATSGFSMAGVSVVLAQLLSTL